MWFEVIIVVDIIVIIFLLFLLAPGFPELNERPYVCDRCMRSYTTPQALTWHVSGQHPEILHESVGEVRPMMIKGPYK